MLGNNKLHNLYMMLENQLQLKGALPSAAHQTNYSLGIDVLLWALHISYSPRTVRIISSCTHNVPGYLHVY